MRLIPDGWLLLIAAVRHVLRAMSADSWRVFLVATLVALGVTWFVQLVLLVWVVPTWAHPSGLLAGHDSVRFHVVAANQALQIQFEGWTAWHLRPNGWGISGLMSAWYAVFGPYPASWAVVQASVYGLSVALLFAIIFRITADRVLAAFSVLPALLLPSTMVLYVFPHRDAFVFLGLMLLIYGLVRISTLDILTGKDRLFWVGFASALVMAGFFIAGSVRIFTAELFVGLVGIVFLILIFRAGFCSLHRRSVQFGLLLGPVVALALIAIMVSGGKVGHFDAELKSVKVIPATVTHPLLEDRGPVETPKPRAAIEDSESTDARWKRTLWLPGFLDDNLRRVAGARDRFLRISGHGRSVIDPEIQFRSVPDMWAYLPRALQIGLAAPFPEYWKAHPDAPLSRNLERLVVGWEMVFLYTLFPFALYTVWWRGREVVLWVALVPALSWVLVYATTVPVVGALVRYRYGAYLLIVAIAMAGLGEAVRRVRRRSLAVKKMESKVKQQRMARAATQERGG